MKGKEFEEESERMFNERMRYYKGNVCELTGEQCDFCESRYSERTNDCRRCLVPIYTWMLENKVRE